MMIDNDDNDDDDDEYDDIVDRSYFAEKCDNGNLRDNGYRIGYNKGSRCDSATSHSQLTV